GAARVAAGADAGGRRSGVAAGEGAERRARGGAAGWAGSAAARDLLLSPDGGAAHAVAGVPTRAGVAERPALARRGRRLLPDLQHPLPAGAARRDEDRRAAPARAGPVPRPPAHGPVR